MPATLEKPKSTTTAPTLPGLGIPLGVCEASADALAYLDDAADLQQRIEAMHSARADVFGCGTRMPLAELWQAGRALEEDRTALEAELAALLWKRFNLLPTMLPDFQEAADGAKRQYEETLAQEVARLREVGIGDSFPAHISTQAADIQLRHRAEDQEWCRVAEGASNRAADALQRLEAQIGVAPSAKHGYIGWRPAAAEHSLVERVLALQPAPPRPELSEREQHLFREVGLFNRSLLPEHLAVVGKIADVLENFWGRVHLDRLSAPVWKQIRPLLERLPMTREVSQLLASDGKKHVV